MHNAILKTYMKCWNKAILGGSFFIIDPISDKDYKFDNIHLDNLGLDSWFGPDSVVFEEKPSCGLM